MSEGNESYLRFSLEESVWFQKGQEVAELVSVSLDPNISIHENDQYVTIEGALQLSGEYKRHPAVEAEVEEGSFSPKFVQQVEEREEGICEFVHRFPVDITIPNNRIQSIYDIDVEIESFDYVFPERSCMKLTADLTISGLYGEQQHVVVEDEEEDVLEPVDRAVEHEDEVIREEAHLVEEIEAAASARVEEPEVHASANDLFTPFAAEARKEPDEEEIIINEVEPASSVNHQWKPEKMVSAEEKEEPKEPAEPATPEISFSAQRQEANFKNAGIFESPEADLEVDEGNDESPDVMESSSSSEPVVKKKKKKSKKDAMSLTEFFARKDEEEDVVRLKVCIVQNGDSIDQIAERYEVPAHQLLKVNQLELNQDVYEGQVLYIPMAVSQK